MGSNTDELISRFENEIEDRNGFIGNLVAAAQNEGRDLDQKEMELITAAKDRIGIAAAQIEPLKDAQKITLESRAASASYAAETAALRSPKVAQMEYRSASGYTLDKWKAQVGDNDAMQWLDLYHRAAAHQITSDNPGIIPSSLLEPILNFVDISRPLVGAIGPQGLTGSGYVSRVTQHTSIAKQTAEKTELASRKMTITKTPIDAETFGGYVNVSRQNIDWSQPNALDVVINDLAGQYAIETENEAASVVWAGGVGSPTPIPATPTSADVSAAIWAAAGASYAALHGLGSLIVALSPDMLGLVGPLFALINPTNVEGSGFSASNFASGAQGAVSGIKFVMSAGLDANQIMVVNSAAVSVYEDRVGALQVVEPSVLGVQVAYAGYFKPFIFEPAGIQKIAVTP